MIEARSCARAHGYRAYISWSSGGAVLAERRRRCRHNGSWSNPLGSGVLWDCVDNAHAINKYVTSYDCCASCSCPATRSSLVMAEYCAHNTIRLSLQMMVLSAGP